MYLKLLVSTLTSKVNIWNINLEKNITNFHHIILYVILKRNINNLLKYKYDEVWKLDGKERIISWAEKKS